MKKIMGAISEKALVDMAEQYLKTERSQTNGYTNNSPRWQFAEDRIIDSVKLPV